MTILYDWKKILRASDRKVGHIITIIDMLTFNRKVRSKKDIRSKFINRDFSGDSYLINPEELLRYRMCYTRKELAQYIALASYRSYAEYILTGDSSLSIRKSPIDLDKIRSNRLLSVEGNKIIFLYERLKEKN